MSGRGPHARDEALFGPRWLTPLVTATDELSWLLSRDYAAPSATKIVGDRHGLRVRQRTAVQRCACTDAARVSRDQRRLDPGGLGGRTLWIDGFNSLITCEAALAGGIVLVGRDRAHRDLASVHGSYRRVATTVTAIEALGLAIADSGATNVVWLLDRPVSNSGKLSHVLLEVADERGWDWSTRLLNAPDRALAAHDGVVATSDAWILDRCQAWVDLPGAAIARGSIPSPWLLDLGRCGDDAPGP